MLKSPNKLKRFALLIVILIVLSIFCAGAFAATVPSWSDFLDQYVIDNNISLPTATDLAKAEAAYNALLKANNPSLAAAGATTTGSLTTGSLAVVADAEMFGPGSMGLAKPSVLRVFSGPTGTITGAVGDRISLEIMTIPYDVKYTTVVKDKNIDAATALKIELDKKTNSSINRDKNIKGLEPKIPVMAAFAINPKLTTDAPKSDSAAVTTARVSNPNKSVGYVDEYGNFVFKNPGNAVVIVQCQGQMVEINVSCTE